MTETVVRVVDVHLMRWRDTAPEYLVMQRSDGELYEHVWQGVTGGIVEGETAWQAALREVQEETGLTPISMWTVDRVNLFYEAASDQLIQIPVFGVELPAGEIRLSAEHQKYRWCSVEEAANLLLWEQQRQGLLAFHQMLTVPTAKLRWMKINLEVKR